MIHRYILLLLTMMLCGFTHAAKILTQSPDGGLAVTFQINKGIPYYKVSWQKEEVLSLSRMGYVLFDGDLDQDFKVVGVKETRMMRNGMNCMVRKTPYAIITTKPPLCCSRPAGRDAS